MKSPKELMALSELLQDWHDSLNLPENYKNLTLEQIALLNGECLLDIIQQTSDALHACAVTSQECTKDQA